MIVQPFSSVDEALSFLNRRVPLADTIVELSEGIVDPVSEDDGEVLNQEVRRRIEAVLGSPLNEKDMYRGTYQIRIAKGTDVDSAIGSIRDILERLLASQGDIAVEANPVADLYPPKQA